MSGWLALLRDCLAAAGSLDGTQPTTGDQSTTSTTKPSTHHHYRHHVHHHMKTASSLHHPSTPAERQATQNLNQQQLQGGSMQNTAQPAGSNMNMQPGNAGYTQPQGTQPQGTMENQPSNATYTQPQGSQGMQPGNAGYRLRVQKAPRIFFGLNGRHEKPRKSGQLSVVSSQLSVEATNN